jgi:hypothetical protein
MMKRLLIGLAALAILATVANAAVVQFQILNKPGQAGTGTTSSDGSLSTDGKYVAGYTIDTGVVTYAFPAYWVLDPDGGSAPVRVNGNGGWGAGTYTGIDHKGTGTIWTGANAGSTVYSATNFTGRYGNPIIAGGLKNHLGTSSESTTGSSNAVAATADGADVWIAGSWTAGTQSKGNDALVWKSTAGVMNTTAVYHPTGTGKTGFTSIASNGNAIGTDKGGVGYTGATGRNRAVYWTTANTTALLAIPSYAGNGTTTETQGFGVSDDGTKFVGLGWQIPDNSIKGFLWTMGGASSVKLERPNGWTGTPTAVYAYDVTNNGTVAGNAYMDDSALPGGFAGNHDVGTIWWPGDTVGTRVIDALIAAGIYDTNIRQLNRCYGIAQLPDGKIAISGEGTYWLDDLHTTYGTRAYYAVLPEPATLGFLALGGLALLRRRR